MKLLIYTQKVDSKDTVLGFFHTWLKEFSKKADSIKVICLEKGEYDLPANIEVMSLGKESNVSKFKYLINFYKFLSSASGSYDKVFVHMNQEYVLLGGLYWLFKGIPVYFWRNHPKGSILTTIAVAFSKKVFCTSTGSFTAKFKRSVIMPVGTDTDLFKPIVGAIRKKFSVCMVGRISPIKHIELALVAINQLILSGAQISLTVIGSPPSEKDMQYNDSLLDYINEHNLSTYVRLKGAVPPEELPEIYSTHEVCLNLTEDGSFDKTIVECASCGAIPLVSNQSLVDILPDTCITDKNPKAISFSLERVLDTTEQLKIHDKLKSFVESQSLKALIGKLFDEFEPLF